MPTIDLEKAVETDTADPRSDELLRSLREYANERKRSVRGESVAIPSESVTFPQLPRLAVHGRTIAVALAIGLALTCVLGWMALREPALPPALSQEDFSFLREVGTVKARPPHLYITVPTPTWRKYSNREALDLVDSVSDRASQVGYVGVHFLDGDGRVVGQWRKDSGPKLLAAPGH